MQVAELANLLELAKLRIEIDDQRKVIEVLTAENVELCRALMLRCTPAVPPKD